MSAKLVQDFAAAFNRQDMEALLGLFTETATYDDVFYGRYAGRARLRDLFARMFREGRDYHWSMDVVVAEERRAAAEWSFDYTVTEAVPRSAGRKIRFGGMSLFEFAGAKISAYREYADSGVAFLQLGLPPEALAKVLAKKLP